MAAVAVVCIHTTSPTFSRYGDCPELLWWFSNVLNAASRWAVPVFVMITGYLTLSRPINSPRYFCFKKLSGIAWPIFFWTAFYCFVRVIKKEPLNDIGISILMGQPYYHLWYLYMLLGLIFAIPLLACVVQPERITARNLTYLALLLFTLLLIRWVESWFCKGALKFMWSWISFAGYFLFGHLFSRLDGDQISKIRNRWLTFFLLFSVLSIALGNWLSYKINLHEGLGHVWGDPISPFVILSSFSIYLLFLKNNRKLPSNKWLEPLALACLGVYLIHPAVLLFVHQVKDPFSYSSAVSLTVELILVTLISFSSIMVIRRIPVVKKIV